MRALVVIVAVVLGGGGALTAKILVERAEDRLDARVHELEMDRYADMRHADDRVRALDQRPRWWCGTKELTCYRNARDCERIDEYRPSGHGCTPQRIAYCGGRRNGDCYDTLVACEHYEDESYRDAERRGDVRLVAMCTGVE